MPLFQKIECGKGWGGIWKISESFDELCGMLPRGDYHRRQALRFASARRRMEYLAVRVLVYALTGEERPIGYLSSGRPFFRDKRLQLSISHTFGYAAVLFSESYEAGIDIEAFSDRIVRLKDRLIGPQEKAETTYEMLLHWSAKEAVFKILDEEGIDFRTDLMVEGLHCASSVAHPDAEGDFSLFYHLQDGKAGMFPVHYATSADFVLTYVFRRL